MIFKIIIAVAVILILCSLCFFMGLILGVSAWQYDDFKKEENKNERD